MVATQERTREQERDEIPELRERDRTLNLAQRLLEVAAVVHRLEYTGKSAQDRTAGSALSIEDVEKAVGQQLVQHGILTIWSHDTDDSLTSFQEEKSSGGTYTMWQTRLKVTVINVDNMEEQFEAWWEDIGGSPMAAGSFTAKGFYKRLFHIARASDEQGESGARVSGYQSRQSTQEPRPPSGGSSRAASGKQVGLVRGEAQSNDRYVNTDRLMMDEVDPLLAAIRSGATHPRLMPRSEEFDQGQGGEGTTLPPRASQYKPASPNQLATIAKLSRLLGSPEEPREDMSSAEASDRITELSREYNERKGAAGPRTS